MAIIKVTNQNFEAEVLNYNGTVLVDFWADWCGPCKMLSPILERVSASHEDAKICKINVDENPELAKKFQVMSIPMLVAFKDGEAVDTSVGLVSMSKIESMLGL
ncbi:MAG: thioredoxin [Clostridia bacterium]|nr:thioredoxin [Clostridia bacterium]